MYTWKLITCGIVLFSACSFTSAECNTNSCRNTGVCKNDTCVCYDGWQGPQCQFCGGKVRLSASTGTIYDGPGNYTITNKCSWLIDAPDSVIVLRIEQFATECGWDYLYVFDGDSVESPLLAVFTGLMYKEAYSIRRVPEVVARSGSALVHFFSDAAYTMSGFNLTYRLNGCPSAIPATDCSGNGVCIKGTCTCDRGWRGLACHLEICPNNCGAAEGRGICKREKGCSCFGNYRGDDCKQIATYGYWESLTVQGYTPAGSASHGAAVYKGSMYIIAGESYNRGSLSSVYDFNGKIWKTPHVNQGPKMRYGHSTVIYDDKIFLYGGVGNHGPTSEFWTFDISTKTWENITVRAAFCNGSYLKCGPLESTGHTATVVINNINRKADRMVVIFGYSPYLGYLNTVQEYYFETKEWHIINTKGYPVKGGYGHSASWDPLTGKIYIYGGILSASESAQFLSKYLYSYEPNERIWTLLAEAPSARFLHTATFVSESLLLVFGGNTHNDTSHSFGAKCYSADMLAYDVLCDSWSVLKVPKGIHADLARYGHSAVVFEGSLYIYGGFDGQMLSDILKYTPGDCQFDNETTSCLNVKSGVKCIWESRSSSCTPISRMRNDLLLKEAKTHTKRCSNLNHSAATKSVTQKKEKCEHMENCFSCVQPTNECVWCGNSCILNTKCNNSELYPIHKLEYCPMDPTSICKQLHTCKACTSQPLCRWNFKNAKCVSHLLNYISTETVGPTQCPSSCSEYSSCLTCTQEECIWCQNEGRCVDTNAYTSSFPYGQCRGWTTTKQMCHSRDLDENSQCNFYKTCAECRDDPGCGWCDDGSKTGLGSCMSGGYTGPSPHSQSTCPSGRWHFTTCPLCQCNGHANCTSNTSTCIDCKNLTTGNNCEYCIKGYWGKPINGGKCTQCNCNKQADDCHRETGKCYCTTKGVIGDNCEECDTINNYHLDPNNKLCYYNLITNYQYTFNLSKQHEIHYKQIYFRNSPTCADTDVDFSIICSVLAKVNVSVRIGNSLDETPVHTNLNCTTVSLKFSKCSYNFGTKNNVNMTTFYVYVYDFRTPLWIQTSFVQYPFPNIYEQLLTKQLSKLPLTKNQDSETPSD